MAESRAYPFQLTIPTVNRRYIIKPKRCVPLESEAKFIKTCY